MTDDEVLTIKDIAEPLEPDEKTVYAMTQQAEISVFKVHGSVAHPAIGSRPLDEQVAEGWRQWRRLRSS